MGSSERGGHENPVEGGTGGVASARRSVPREILAAKLDGIGLDTVNKEFLAIEFKRTQDTRSNYEQGRHEAK